MIAIPMTETTAATMTVVDPELLDESDVVEGVGVFPDEI